MALMIAVPDDLAAHLQRQAEAQRRPVEEVALHLLEEALGLESDLPTLQEVVAAIQATPSTPASLRPAQGSLADALRQAPAVSDFDLDAWNREWDAVESKIDLLSKR